MKPKYKFQWRDLLMNKFFDLLIVIAGVSIAFQLNNWKLENDQRNMERFYLESIAVDLEKDIRSSDNILTDLKRDQRLIASYLSHHSRVNEPLDSLASVIVETLGFETFRGNQDTYATLIASNGLSSLEDQQLRTELTEYYKGYVSIARFENVYTTFLYQLNDYFSPFCDYANVKIIDSSVAKKIQTNNNLTLTNEQLKNGIEDYTELITNAKTLKKRIEKQLTSR